MSDITLNEILTGNPEKIKDAWYDWFCSDKALVGRAKQSSSLLKILAPKVQKLFTNPMVFYKQNPGRHGKYDTDTVLTQIYEKDYPNGSVRVCISITKYISKSKYAINHTEYELSIWKEGEDFPELPNAASLDKKEFKHMLKELSI